MVAVWKTPMETGGGVDELVIYGPNSFGESWQSTDPVESNCT